MLKYTGSPVREQSVPCLAELSLGSFASPPASVSPVRWRQDGSFPADFQTLSRLRNPDTGVAGTNPLVAKLGHFAELDRADIAAIEALSACSKPYRAGHILAHENTPSDHVFLIMRGMACRHKLLRGGQRQILGFLIPGDLCDLNFISHNSTDHNVSLLSGSDLVKIPRRLLIDLFARHPRIVRALSLAALLDVAILREWLLSVGQRSAVERLSHFFCEMKVRLESIGQLGNDGFIELPINQSTLADATGLTTVHVNRTLQRLRSDGLIRFGQKRLAILDFDRLAALAGFDANYLHLRRYPR